MSIDNHQSQEPLVDADGKTTVVSQVFLDKLVAEIRALRAEVNDHESRITALEP